MKLGKPIAFALIAQLLALPVTAGMVILCFGSDGHVALESAGAARCCREWADVHRAPGDADHAAAFEPSSAACCDDVALSVESATLTVPSQKVSAAAAAACRVSAPASPLPSPCSPVLPLATDPPVGASLRTVVLRA